MSPIATVFTIVALVFVSLACGLMMAIDRETD